MVGAHSAYPAKGRPQMHCSLRTLSSLLAILFLLAACTPAAPGTTAAPTEDERPRVVV